MTVTVVPKSGDEPAPSMSIVQVATCTRELKLLVGTICRSSVDSAVVGCRVAELCAFEKLILELSPTQPELVPTALDLAGRQRIGVASHILLWLGRASSKEVELQASPRMSRLALRQPSHFKARCTSRQR